jgi:hypothetical protein
MERQDLIRRYVALKTAIRIYDAENSTSYEEEIANLYTYGLPDPNRWTDEHLKIELECLEANYEPDGSPKTIDA